MTGGVALGTFRRQLLAAHVSEAPDRPSGALPVQPGISPGPRDRYLFCRLQSSFRLLQQIGILFSLITFTGMPRQEATD